MTLKLDLYEYLILGMQFGKGVFDVFNWCVLNTKFYIYLENYLNFKSTYEIMTSM